MEEAQTQEAVETTETTQEPELSDASLADNGVSLASGLAEDEGLTFDFTKNERPEEFPEDFWDTENNVVNINALYSDYKRQEKRVADLREKLGRGEHKPPKEPTDYKFEPTEKAASFIKEDDPLVAAAQEVAHKYGMSQDQFSGFMAEITDRMVDVSNTMYDQDSPEAEAARQSYIQEEMKKIGPNAPQVIRSVQSWAKELQNQGIFSEQDMETFTNEGLTSARMVQMMNRLRFSMGGEQVPTDSFDDGLPSDQEISMKLNSLYEEAVTTGDSSKFQNYEAEIMEKRKRAGRGDKLMF